MMKVLVSDIKLESWSRMRGGMIEDGVIVELSRYNLNDVLCQMLEDYGEDELIKRIKALD
jgi:hypothetical protein